MLKKVFSVIASVVLIVGLLLVIAAALFVRFETIMFRFSLLPITLGVIAASLVIGFVYTACKMFAEWLDDRKKQKKEEMEENE